MRKIDEEQFLDIASDAIQKAESVDCSFADFCEGLTILLDELRARHEQAEDELRSQQ